MRELSLEDGRIRDAFLAVPRELFVPEFAARERCSRSQLMVSVPAR